MKYCLSIVVMMIALAGTAQTKQMAQALENAELLERTVFGTKDSATLDNLFASTLAYIHSSGKVETRAQALKGILNNKSTYAKQDTLPEYDVRKSGDSIIVLQAFVASEKKADGTINPLRITIETVWAREDGKMKLFRRKANKL